MVVPPPSVPKYSLYPVGASPSPASQLRLEYMEAFVTLFGDGLMAQLGIEGPTSPMVNLTFRQLLLPNCQYCYRQKVYPG